MRCISLISDFGLSDASVAIAKSILMQHNPGVPVVDISHDVTPFVITEAAYLLSSAYPHFPKGTCHVIFSAVSLSRNPVLVLVEKNGQYFLAPDNGVLSLAFGADPEQLWKCFELKDGATFRDWEHRCAWLIQQLESNSPAQLGLPLLETEGRSQLWPVPVISGQSVECHVIYIDAYENVVLNINREQFEKIRNGRTFYIDLVNTGKISEVSEYYHDVPKDEALCRFNSAGYMEIAINGGNAAGLFGFKAHNARQLFYTTVKIFFE